MMVSIEIFLVMADENSRRYTALEVIALLEQRDEYD